MLQGIALVYDVTGHEIERGLAALEGWLTFLFEVMPPVCLMLAT